MPKQKFTKKNINRTQNSFCTYKLYDPQGEMIRVGSTRRCRNRLNQHIGKIKAKYFSSKSANSWKQAHSREKRDCNNRNPKLNQKCG